MVTASFRFYDALAGFLPRERRGHEFQSPCARDATVKHMIEALGVPHTEVELVLVNGATSGFDHLLRDGDRVAVYPAFGLLDVGGLQRLRAWPAGRLRFVADAHLGGLARLLRMAGFDTLYDNAYRDDEIERIARMDERVLLTRDRELLKRRSVELGCYLHALDPLDQLLFLGAGERQRPVVGLRIGHDAVALAHAGARRALDANGKRERRNGIGHAVMRGNRGTAHILHQPRRPAGRTCARGANPSSTRARNRRRW